MLDARSRAEGLCLSVDTSSAAVAERALEAGAAIVNDVTALGDPGMPAVVAKLGAGLVLMHMRGTPATMQRDPRYDDVTREVDRGAERAAARPRRSAGIAAECVAFDPGIGFGKTLEHNLELLARLGELRALGRPVMVGASRKSFIGRLTRRGRSTAGWRAVSAAHALAVWGGASVMRTHDVRGDRAGGGGGARDRDRASRRSGVRRHPAVGANRASTEFPRRRGPHHLLGSMRRTTRAPS